MCAKWSYKKDVLGVAMWFVFPIAAVLLMMLAMAAPIALAGLAAIAGSIAILKANRHRSKRKQND